jgi:hypothetical protein
MGEAWDVLGWVDEPPTRLVGCRIQVVRLPAHTLGQAQRTQRFPRSLVVGILINVFLSSDPGPLHAKLVREYIWPTDRPRPASLGPSPVEIRPSEHSQISDGGVKDDRSCSVVRRSTDCTVPVGGGRRSIGVEDRHRAGGRVKVHLRTRRGGSMVESRCGGGVKVRRAAAWLRECGGWKHGACRVWAKWTSGVRAYISSGVGLGFGNAGR